MDSDGIANANLDHLFFLPFPENITIAAPQGYWFGKDGIIVGNFLWLFFDQRASPKEK